MSFKNTDRYSFNNPDYVWDLDETEILLIGDSMTHRACVNRPDDIASVLQKKLDKNVINLGMGGAGSLQELAT